MRRRTRRLLLALLLLLLLPVTALLGLLGTETGTRWLLHEALARSSDSYRLQTLRGDLLSELTLEGLAWRAGDTSLELAEAHLAWRPAALLTGLLHIETLRVTGVRFAAPAAAEPAPEPEPAGPPSVPELPLAVRIDAVHVADVETDVGGNRFVLDRADLATRIEDGRMRVETLEAHAPAWQVAARGEVALATPFAFDFRVDWQATVPQAGDFAGGGDLDGDIRQVRFTHSLATPFSAELEGEVNVDGVDSTGRLQASWQGLVLPAGEGEYRSRQGELRFEGGADDLELSLAADATGPGFALEAATLSLTGSVGVAAPHPLNLALAWDVDVGAEPAAVAGTALAGGGSVGGDLERLRVDHALSAPFRLTTGADVGLAADPLTLAVQGSWAGLRWPLTGDAEYLSPAGDYRATGDLQHIEYRLGADLSAVAAAVEGARLDVEGGADLAAPFAFDAALDWRLPLPPDLAGDVTATGGGRVSGDMEAIDVDHAVREPFRLATRGRVRPASDDELLDIEGEWQGLRWPLAGAAQVSSESGRYSARGGLAALRAQLDLALGGPAVPLTEAGFNAEATLALADGFGFDARLGWGGRLPDGSPEGVAVQAEGSASGDLARIEFEHHLTAPFAVDTGGSVVLDGPAPVLDVRGGWRQARWPLATDSPEYRSETGKLTLTGTPADYRLTLEAALAGASIPAVDASLQAAGGTAGADIEALRLRTLGGTASLSGRVDWAPAVAFDLALDGRDLQPGRQWPEWNGRLGFDIAASGRVGDAGPEVSVSRLEVDGVLRGYPLSARGSAEVAGRRVDVPQLRVESGDNRLTLEGVVDETLDLAFDLEAPDLAAFWPGLAGELDAGGSVAGALQAPRIRATASGRQLRFEQHGVDRLSLEADIDAGGGDDSRLDLALADAVLAGEVVPSLTLEARGGPGAHRATLTADATLADLTLALDGRLAGDGWRGTVGRLQVTPARGEPWSLAAPADLSVAGGSTRLERLCLGQGEARLCAAFSQAADGALDGDLEIARLPLAIAGPWLPPGVTLEGSIEADASVAGTAAAPRARLRVAPPPGALVWEREGSEPLRVAWQAFSVDGRFRDDALAAEARLDLGTLGSIAADIALGRAGKDGDRALDGRVDVALDDLAVAAAFAPQIANPEGRVRVAADLGGRLGAPRVDGTASLAQGAVQLPDLGLQIADIALDARNRGRDALVFEGTMRSGEGTLSLAGEMSLDAAAGYPLQVDIDGERFEAARLPEAHVFASPDLNFRRDAELTRLTGSVTVPRADFRVREVPVGAVGVSDDEVVVQEGYREKEPAMAVGMDLQLVLGDEVRFRGFGLDTRFTGRLRVTADPGESLLGEGAVQLVDGTYQAYGQDLSIERGRLLFAGPLDNPALDIRAVRDAGQVTAGLEVSGTASNPSAQVFSEPSLPDAEALSYLLTGRNLGDASSGEGSMLSSAALALGLDNADVLSNKIGRQLGLDEVGVTGDENGAGLTLGKYLTPDLYLSYVLGLFGGQGAVQLEYQLTDRVSVQGRSGAERQAVDLLYRFERD